MKNIKNRSRDDRFCHYLAIQRLSFLSFLLANKCTSKYLSSFVFCSLWYEEVLGERRAAMNCGILQLKNMELLFWSHENYENERITHLAISSRIFSQVDLVRRGRKKTSSLIFIGFFLINSVATSDALKNSLVKKPILSYEINKDLLIYWSVGLQNSFSNLHTFPGSMLPFVHNIHQFLNNSLLIFILQKILSPQEL